MKHYKVLLVCSGGMSTSVLMNKMKDYAKEHELDIKVAACGTTQYLEEVSAYDIVLLGPQISYRKQQIASTVSVPVVAINPQDYAFGNIEHILKDVDVHL